jgi:homoserine acetyltransferase
MVSIQLQLKIIEILLLEIFKFLLKGRVLKIDLFALIGGSVGGGIAWEILALEPKLAKFYSIATDWKATDWLIANCYLQEQI